MKKWIIGAILLAVAGPITLRVMAAKVTAEAADVSLDLRGPTGEVLGIGFSPLAISDSIDSLESAQFALVLSVRVDNPNPVGFALKRIDFTAQVRDGPIYAGTMEFPEETRPAIGPNGETFVDVVAYIPVSSVIENVTEVLSGDAVCRVSGEVRLGVWLGTSTASFQFEQRLSLAELF